MHLNAKVAFLKYNSLATGSHFNSFSAGVTWSNFLTPQHSKIENSYLEKNSCKILILSNILFCFLKIYKQRVSSGIFVFLKEAKLPFDRLTKIICFIQCLKQAKFPS
jgi:hypothetical protein